MSSQVTRARGHVADRARAGILIEIMNDVGLSKKEFLELLER